MGELCSLVTRIEQRYLDDEDEITNNDIIITNYSLPPRKDRNGGLELIVLNHSGISHIGDLDRFSSLVKHVSEVDLAWNNISDWDTVAVMLSHLNNLRTLNLSHNPLCRNECSPNIPKMESLKMLVLNGTHLHSAVLRILLLQMPKVQELHLSENTLHIDDNVPISSSVKTIHLNRCGFSTWKDALNVLRLFPSRKTAFLYDNPFDIIRNEDMGHEEFETLNCINISKTQIADWESVEHLSSLNGLTDLRITHVPLLEEYSEEERHHLVVGRLTSLLYLNGSPISDVQRENAERFFIRYYQDKENKPAQYSSLIAKHGELERLAKVDLTPVRSCTVKIECEDNNYTAEKVVILDQTIGDFMKSLEDEVGLKYSRMRMFYTSPNYNFAQECQYHNLALHALRVEDGDCFMIQEKLVVPKRRKQTSTSSS